MGLNGGVAFSSFYRPKQKDIVRKNYHLGKLWIFKTLQWKPDVKEVFKSLFHLMLGVGCTEYFQVHSVGIICGRRHILRKVWA